MDKSLARATLNATGELTYCFNSRANNYPGFTNQVQQILLQHEAVLGAKWRRIPGTYETPAAAKAAGCQVQHNMPEVHGCSGCAAWVHYLNWPVLIEYRWQLGYNSTNGWLTTIAHETVHIYGLHEHYDDTNFRSYRNTYGRWAHGMFGDPGTSVDAPTVMDFGTGVSTITDYDVKHSCLLLGSLSGCYQEPEPMPEWGACDSNGAGTWCYNNWDGTWHWTVWTPTEWRFNPEQPWGWYCVAGCP